MRQKLHMHRATATCCGLWFLLATSISARGDCGTTTLPAYWSFEEFPADQILVDANGVSATDWCGEPTAATTESIARVVATNYPPPPSFDWNEDGDGASDDEEWLAGTDPLNSNSYFHVLTTLHESGSNIVTWYGTTNTGVFTDFRMLRSTNLTDPASWALVETNMPRHPTGTNTWIDPAPPSTPAVFYRPALPVEM